MVEIDDGTDEFAKNVKQNSTSNEAVEANGRPEYH